ncbi:imidazole glycerol phosphate synthase subunit HisF [Francisellaceae bacterium]|nr:imidazole glycerol phosphate synthase subunit HisF [Francisellaceae bacterium]
MLAKRIIPCLDVKDGRVVKGVQFKNHKVVGDILELARYYSDQGADELVFYDITASSDQRGVCKAWVNDVAREINIPFCVAGGIRSLEDAEAALQAGADKISINSPALERPELIDELVKCFGQQCVVIGIDSRRINNNYSVCQYTGNAEKTIMTQRDTFSWVKEVQERGAGEIVLNCMNQDGVKKGYDLEQLSLVRGVTNIPLIASGGAGSLSDFREVFDKTNVEGALAASVFHSKIIEIPQLKNYLLELGITVRKI